MMRNTEDVILDIKKLVNTKGYIYALCIILFDDFHFDLNKIHEVDYKAKLSIKECSLIIGFLVQKKIDFSTPASPEEVFILIEKTYKLMRELQLSFNAPIISKLQDLLANQKGEKFEDTQQERLNFFVKDNGMVEPILYAGDGVYDFQYLEYLESKYKYDQEWLIKNKGFEIDGCKKIVNHIKELLQLKVKVVLPINIKESFAIIAGKARKKMKGRFSRKEIEEAERKMLISATFYKYIKLFPNPPEDTKRDNKEDWDKFYSNLLDLFTVTPLDFQNIDHILVKSFFHNFSFAPGCNETYNGPGHFNILNSRPIIKLESGRYFIPINYLVAEAVYESPFYWMWDDKQYRNTLAKHRGDVGEEIAYNLLVKVFGSNNTYKSVIVETIKGKRDTDIDVLCLLGNKAVCVQVKSKKLTLTARRGDFDQLSKDFNAAIQDAYDQGVISREAILNRRSRFYNNNGDEIPIQQEIDEVYIMVLTTENYPSLVHQVHMMLVKDNKVPYPLVLSVFDLELLVHYLNDRYDFLYYVRQRIDLVEYFKADEELVYLGYHLSHKLCKIDGYNWATIENDFGAIIDRNYYPHKTGVAHLLNENDDPILNRWKDPNFDLFIRAIKLSGHPKATDIVFHLLDWSGNSRKNIVERMTEIKHISHRESVTKSIAIPTPPNFGLSYIALDIANPAELAERVVVYSNLRKYLSKCNAWLGMGSFSDSPNLIDFIFYNNESWEIDLKLENEHKELIEEMKKTPFTPIKGSKKIGRNDPCPCNSGKKYKKCCGR